MSFEVKSFKFIKISNYHFRFIRLTKSKLTLTKKLRRAKRTPKVEKMLEDLPITQTQLSYIMFCKVSIKIQNYHFLRTPLNKMYNSDERPLLDQDSSAPHQEQFLAKIQTCRPLQIIAHQIKLLKRTLFK